MYIKYPLRNSACTLCNFAKPINSYYAEFRKEASEFHKGKPEFYNFAQNKSDGAE